ncbi:hypothetical protein BJX64DRAFT_294952 [Aspergillus heterothallicus]
MAASMRRSYFYNMERRQTSPENSNTRDGYKDIVGILLAHGANIEGTDGFPFTVLHDAVMTPQAENCVPMLLAAGSNFHAGIFDLFANGGSPPLAHPMDAIRQRKNDGRGSTTLKLLLEVGARVGEIESYDGIIAFVSYSNLIAAA